MKLPNKAVFIFLLVAFIILLNKMLTSRWLWSMKSVHTKPKCLDGHLITVIDGGKLANNIWEYISLFSVVHLYSHKINFLPHCSEMLKAKLEYVFERVSIPGTSEIPKFCFNVQDPYILQLNKSFGFDKIHNNKRRPVVLAKYSARYREVLQYGFRRIKTELKFRQKYVTNSYKIFNKIKSTFNLHQKNVTFVGIHYRGTDYIDLLKRNYNSLFKGPPTYKYYLKAMDYFKKNYNNVVFILITIDFSWLRENLPFLMQNNSLVVNPVQQGHVKDLVLLSHCNHSIINYGTYGTTAALFADGTTFVYDLGISLDQRGPTIAMGIAEILSNWHLLK